MDEASSPIPGSLILKEFPVGFRWAASDLGFVIIHSLSANQILLGRISMSSWSNLGCRGFLSST